MTKTINIDSVNQPVKKRGRKSKKDLLEQNKESNITVLIEENNNNTIIDTNTNINDILISVDIDSENVVNNEINILEDKIIEELKPGTKKRGRKPKGGKIIQQVTPLNNNKDSKPNIILHLKCSLKDLYNNTLLGTNIESFTFNSCKNDTTFEIITNNELSLLQNNYNEISVSNLNNNKYEEEIENNYDDNYEQEISSKNKDNDIKEVWK